MNSSLHTPLFAQLGEKFFAYTAPQALQNPQLISCNQRLAETFPVDCSTLATWLNGDLPTSTRSLASVYSGHQFGQYNPQLGDGRALIIGDLIDSKNQRWELQTKGSGLTPFSRFGDGRAVLRSTIREYLCSEAMHALHIPTTRALAMINSQTPVEREQTETAACLLRAAPSHIRFGHFEYFYYTQQHSELKQLADFVITHFYPQHLGSAGKANYGAWLQEIVQRTAELIAQWQAVGFCHGVMNTDNMSILGLTIDYGPFAFMQTFDPNFICNHSDHYGRYAYKQQIATGQWNLQALAHALSPLIAQEDIKQALASYHAIFLRHYRTLLLNKLGLEASTEEQDDALIAEVLHLLTQSRIDYTQFFRELSEKNLEQCAELATHFFQPKAFLHWLSKYQQRFSTQDDRTRQHAMLSKNPKIVLHNYLAQRVITAAEKGDNTPLEQALFALQHPFSAVQESALFSGIAAHEENIILSCSS